MKRWIYIGGGNGADGTITAQSRQVLVTVVGSGTNAVGQPQRFYRLEARNP